MCKEKIKALLTPTLPKKEKTPSSHSNKKKRRGAETKNRIRASGQPLEKESRNVVLRKRILSPSPQIRKGLEAFSYLARKREEEREYKGREEKRCGEERQREKGGMFHITQGK